MSAPAMSLERWLAVELPRLRAIGGWVVEPDGAIRTFAHGYPWCCPLTAVERHATLNWEACSARIGLSRDDAWRIVSAADRRSWNGTQADLRLLRRELLSGLGLTERAA